MWKGFQKLGLKQSHQANWQKSVFEVYDGAALPLEWSAELRATCDSVGIHYFTAPYDIEILKQLSKFVCAWKVGSGDITWHDHIRKMSRDGKPIMLATGASTMAEVRAAVGIILEQTADLVLMQCNTNYTASIENFHYISLNVLRAYEQIFPGVVLGLSDHTPGHTTVLGAVALGARVIEKHFTDDTTREGPDHIFSMDPQTWRAMVDATRHLEAALGTPEKKIMDNEKETVIVQRRSIHAKARIDIGEIINSDSLIPLRPCPEDGIPPYRVNELLGKRATKQIEKGDYVRFEDVI